MNLRLAVVASVVALALTACGPQDTAPDADGTWVGAITTEGNITTVVNESGSVWGGEATLVEELSIGVEAGADEYMFGNVRAVAIAGERIYVLDRSIPTVRVYDFGGKHLLNIGRGGQGPGEFTNPSLLAVVGSDRIYVRTQANLQVFSGNGEHVAVFNEPGGVVRPLVVDDREDVVYVPVGWSTGPTRDDFHGGYVGIRPDGTRTERIENPSLVEWRPWALIADQGGRSRQQAVPYSPSTVWMRTSSGTVVQAVSDVYRLESIHADGSTRVITRDVAALPVSDAERDWHRSYTELVMRFVQPDWKWNANPIPSTKPFFERFYTDSEEVIWARRILRTEAIALCDEDFASAIEEQRPPRRCFRDIEGFDVFEQEGRYLGSVELPPVTIVAQPAIERSTVVFATEDEAGTIMVKRYRLVLPEER